MTKKNTNDKPLIGITVGDINGVGPEVIIKSLMDNRLTKSFTPIIYSSAKVISFYRKNLDLQSFNYYQTKGLDNINPKKVNVLNIWDENVEIKPGEENEDGGKYALLSLEKASQDLKDGKIHGIVTAPINKNNIQSDDFAFPGHTEYLAQKFEVDDNLMFLVSDTLRVGVVTGHIPLKDVPGKITGEAIKKKLKIMIKSLKKDFGIKKPKIAVMGLNPHAGENGLLGKEEQEIIGPALEEERNNGNLVFGPFPADGFFGSDQFNSYDGILAMYHDQGLIPFKSMAFEHGVNFTAGLPVIRTSPDHGTAYGIAGKNASSETSMRQALYLAYDVWRMRQENS